MSRSNGWLRRAMVPFLPNWGQGDYSVPMATVRGVPDEDHIDPRISVKEYTDNENVISIEMLFGNDHSRGGTWMMQNYTPDQCLQIVASILSRPSMEAVVQPLLDALNER